MTIETARARVAARYVQPYHKSAIMAGAWDSGAIVRDELAKLQDADSEAIKDE